MTVRDTNASLSGNRRSGAAGPASGLRSKAGRLLRKRRSLLLGQAALAGLVIGVVGAAPATAAPAPVCPPNPLNTTVSDFSGNCNFGTNSTFELGTTDQGVLYMVDGGEVSAGNIYIAVSANENAAISVRSGSMLVADQLLVVGDSGYGQLYVADGSEATATTVYAGYKQGATGILDVSDKDTLMTITGTLNVGSSGRGQLKVSDGAEVSVGGKAEIGLPYSETDGTIVLQVEGTGSKLSVGTNLLLGISGSAGESQAWVGVGGKIAVADEMVVGSFGEASVILTSSGSSISAGSLVVGDWEAGTMVVRSGATLFADTVVLARPNEGSSPGGVLAIGDGELTPGNPLMAWAPGTVVTDSVTFAGDEAKLIFNHTSDDYTFLPDLVDDGGNTSADIVHYTGTTKLTGDGSTFAGTVTMYGGTLLINNALGAAGSNIAFSSANEDAKTIGGTGTFGGGIYLENGGVLSPGESDSTGTFTIGGRLSLDSDAVTVFQLNTADVAGGETNDFISVGGDLTLGGTLEASVTAAGYYYLFDYGGELSGSFGTVTVSGVADAESAIDTDVAGEVNLAVTIGGGGEPQTMQFWDGGDLKADKTVDGGDGIWNAANTNWTTSDGGKNDIWGSQVGIFTSAAGTVTVEDTQEFDTLQFKTDGYLVQDGALAFAPASGDAGTINVDANVTTTIASSLVDGTASTLIKAGDGTLSLTGANTYTGGTRVLAGRLIGRTGAIGGDIANAGTVEFAQASDDTFAGSIGGFNGVDGQMVKSGAGSLTLTGTSNLDWTIEEGNLVSNTELFRGDLNIAENAAMTFGQAFDGAYAGTISGSGDILFTGGGLVTLTGNSAGYTGASTVTDFTLHLDGNVGGTLTLSGSGRLTGNGTVGSTNVGNGGTVSPGNSIGTINVAGDVSFGPGSTYEVEADPRGASSDLIAATGTATLSGGDVVHIGFDGFYEAESEYTILTADAGVTGTFDGVTTALAYLDPMLDYTANSVLLRLTRNGSAFERYAQTPNQRAAAYGVESLGAGNPVYDAVLGIDTADAPTAFDALSGEIHASLKTGLIEDSRFVRDTALARMRAATGAACEQPSGAAPLTAAQTAERAENGCVDDLSAPGFGAWMQAFGGMGHVDGDGNAAKLDTDTGGVTIGSDAGFGDTGIAGFMVGYQSSSYKVDERASSADATSYQIGVYAGTSVNGFNIRGGAAYAWSDIDTKRTAAFPGFSDYLTGSTNGGTAQIFGEIGYEFDMGTATIEPFAGLAYVSVHTDAYSETGGAAALAIASDTTDTTYSTLGVRGSMAFDDTARVTGMLGWRHAYGSLAPNSVNAFAGGSPFTVAGVPVGEDVALISAGIEFDLDAVTGNGIQDASLSLSYDGQFGSGVTDSAAFARLSFKF